MDTEPTAEELEHRRRMQFAKHLNWGAMDAWERRHRFVRETELFGKRYAWYTEIATGKAVLVGPLRNG